MAVARLCTIFTTTITMQRISSAPGQRDADQSIAWKTALAFPGAEKVLLYSYRVDVYLSFREVFVRELFSGFMGK